MSDFIKRGQTDCWPWQKNPEDAPNKNAKMACNNPMCNNPRHITKETDHKETDPEETDPEETDPAEMLELTVANLTVVLAEIDMDGYVVDNETLDLLTKAEKAGKNRQSALEAIDLERQTRP